MVLKTAEVSLKKARGLTGSYCGVGKREQASLAVHWLVLSHTVYLERWRVLP